MLYWLENWFHMKGHMLFAARPQVLYLFWAYLLFRLLLFDTNYMVTPEVIRKVLRIPALTLCVLFLAKFINMYLENRGTNGKILQSILIIGVLLFMLCAAILVTYYFIYIRKSTAKDHLPPKMAVVPLYPERVMFRKKFILTFELIMLCAIAVLFYRFY